MAMDASTLLGKYKDASLAHRVFTNHTEHDLGKLAEIAKAFLWQRAKNIIQSAGNHAVLFSYSSDGTPQLIRETVVHELPGERILRKKVKRGA